MQCRGRGGTWISKVKGRADEGMVALGSVMEVDRIGTHEAAGADMGRRRVHCSITGAPRLVNGACARWYLIVQELHRFLIAIARTLVNCDDLEGGREGERGYLNTLGGFVQCGSSQKEEG